jgi:hypothetical protein
MQVTAVDELAAAALARFLRDRDCAVYRPPGSDTLQVSPLGSIQAELAGPLLAAHLQDWLLEHPGTAVGLDPRR